jgi:tripartite-type tricarboxylate transporter receptor subunit TctC
MSAKWVLQMASACLVALGADNICAQNFPNRPIRIITTEVGSGNDFTARLISSALLDGLGQHVVVDNRGNIAGEIVAKATPDGYTLLSWGSPLWLAPYLREKVAYDPVKDFAPVTLMATSPNILVVHPSLAVKSVKDLIALAKVRPGDLNYSSPGSGGSPHLAAELFKSMAGVKIIHVAYKGMGSAILGVIRGEVQIMFPSAAAVTPHIKSGRLRALAVTSARPTALAPGLPTMAVSGLAGYESLGMFGVFAPAGTPAPIVNRLNQEMVRVLNKPDIKQKFFDSGTETVGNTPEEFSAIVKSDMAKMGKLIKDAGIRAD